MPERQIGRRCGIYRYRSTHKLSRPSQRSRHAGLSGNSFALPHSFIVCEKEGVLLEDWPADRAAKLIALEGRFRSSGRSVEKISRIHRAIPNKLENTSVKIIRSRTSDGIDYSAGGSSVFRRIVVGDHGEFLHGIDTKCGS